VGSPRVVVVGAGPSGVATSLFLARAGHEVVVVERARFPRDKACGEGLMPPGVGVLRRLGLLEAVLAAGARQLDGVTYSHRGGTPAVFAPFPPPPEGELAWGLGVRRLTFDAVLATALRTEPRVSFLEGVAVHDLLRSGSRVHGVRTADGVIEADAVVAADGLHSRLRSLAGWDRPSRPPARYGMVGHWRVNTAGCHAITVTLAGNHEWYEAPVGQDELLVSTLGDKAHLRAIARDYATAARAAIPALHDADMTGETLAAGQFHQRPARIAGDRLFLVGDAAGYDDPTTGEGLGVGLLLGEALAHRLDETLSGRRSLESAAAGYTHDHRRLWRNRRRITALALFMSAHPAISRRAVSSAQSRPQTLSRLLGVNCDYHGFGRLTPRDWLTLAGI
jgi:2-polyprenyl-6-methoxyphenol hydroxylase-like FAD-dependent oxidoreductase